MARLGRRQPFKPLVGKFVASAGGAVTHVATGALTSQSATIAGTSANVKKHAASGVLTAQAATLEGTSAHIAKHAATGVLVAQSATISGTSAHIAKHDASGSLVSSSASISGSGVNGLLSEVILEPSASNWQGTIVQERPRNFLWSRKELENNSSEEESEIIIELAERQVTDLHISEKERKEQLKRELKLKNIELELKHLDALNEQRQLMIDAEIANLMKIVQIEAENEEYLELLMLAAAA